MIQDMAMEQKRKKELSKGKVVNYIRWWQKFESKIKYNIKYQEPVKMKRHKTLFQLEKLVED